MIRLSVYPKYILTLPIVNINHLKFKFYKDQASKPNIPIQLEYLQTDNR